MQSLIGQGDWRIYLHIFIFFYIIIFRLAVHHGLIRAACPDGFGFGIGFGSGVKRRCFAVKLSANPNLELGALLVKRRVFGGWLAS